MAQKKIGEKFLLDQAVVYGRGAFATVFKAIHID